jgi:hypothetical protein
MYAAINDALDEIGEVWEESNDQGRIDIGARVRGLLKRVEDLDKRFSQALKSDVEPGRFVCGMAFEVKINICERTGIDATALKNELPDIAGRFTTHTQYESLIYRAR